MYMFASFPGLNSTPPVFDRLQCAKWRGKAYALTGNYVCFVGVQLMEQCIKVQPWFEFRAGPYVLTGAHEPPKTTKEHVTREYL